MPTDDSTHARTYQRAPTEFLQSGPLIESGTPVTLAFRDRLMQAQADVDSGYVFFEPPSVAELNDYYQNDYPRLHGADYYTVDADYDKGKNEYHTKRVLAAYQSVMGELPRTAFELGCSYGGVVAEMVGCGVATRGADINEDAIRQGATARGNSNIVHAGNLDALAGMQDRVDLIYSIHCLEHDPNMLGVIEACRDRLTEDGLLFISVPNAMYAGSVFGGFRNNWWVTYPQHLHFASPGFIPTICAKLGFLPVYWNTGILFEANAQPSVIDLLKLGGMTAARQELWKLLLLNAGLGMELNFAIVPDNAVTAQRFAATVQRIGGALEFERQLEVQIRRCLRDAETFINPG